jgi:hypothetical protein
MDLLLLLMLLPGVPDEEDVARRPSEPSEREHGEDEAPSGASRKPDEP